MLGKLIKYELRSSFKKLGGLWIAALAILVLNAVILGVYTIPDLENGAVSTFMSVMMLIIPIMLTYITCIAVVIMTLVFVVTRFYKGLLKDEGYLMFTLPVTTGQLIISKAVSALIVNFIGSVVAIIPLAVLGAFYPDVTQMIAAELAAAFAQMELNGAAYAVCMVLLTIVSSIEGIMRLYLSMAIGHRAKKHRVLASIATFVGFNYAYTIFVTCSQVACACNAATMNSDIAMSRYTTGTMIFMIVISLILTVVEFFCTRHILSKKLNLE